METTRHGEGHVNVRSLLRFIIALAMFVCSAFSRAEEITVTHWGAQFYGAPYAVAMEKGWFKSGTFDVTGIITSTGGGTSLRNTLASPMPIGEVALPAVIEAMRAGAKLKIIYSGVGSVAEQVWATRPGEPYHSIKDLKGQRIGYTRPASVSNMLILMALEKSGMKASEVELVAVGGVGALLAAVLQGSIAAGNIHEPLWTRDKDKLQQVFWFKDIMSPAMTQTVGITTEEFMKKRPDAIKAVVEGRLKGVRFIYEHPDEAADIVSKLHKWDPAITRQVFALLVKEKWWDQGAFNMDGMNAMLNGMRLVGEFKGELDWATLIDERFLPADLQTIKK